MSRLAEILGVEENEEFRIKESGITFEFRICNGDRQFKNHDGIWSNCYNEEYLAYLINHPEKIIRKIKLTDQQITAIRGRIAEGFEWMARDEDGELYFYVHKPEKDSDIEFLFDDDLGSASQSFVDLDCCAPDNSPINLRELLKENGIEV